MVEFRTDGEHLARSVSDPSGFTEQTANSCNPAAQTCDTYGFYMMLRFYANNHCRVISCEALYGVDLRQFVEIFNQYSPAFDPGAYEAFDTLASRYDNSNRAGYANSNEGLPSTGKQASANNPRLPGISRCAGSLCGQIIYECKGTKSDCGNAIGQVRAFNEANGFNITLKELDSSSWLGIKRSLLFLGDYVMSVDFLPPQGHLLGEWEPYSKSMAFIGSRWKDGNATGGHEFAHGLGLGHNGIPGTLMYDKIRPTGPITLLPGERNNLLNYYGP